ncbi:MAG: SPFH domain-containing protein [Proteobacteria bacterium]|nr:SPFH domain-containing protein [Pseudomonadota bacterium]
MGIISFVTGGAKELSIARADENKDLWVYKHPDQTIPNGAQLTVDADETALFFRDGQFVGQFAAGAHKLATENVPWLNMLIDKFTGGDRFIAEVFFVNTREHPGIKFGSSVGDVPDPQTGLRVRLMVHGSFSAKVYDPVRFVTGLVGQRRTDNTEFLAWFRSQVAKTIKENIAELVVKKNWPLMKVTSGAYASELEAETIQEVRPHIDPYGVEIIRFGDFSIGMDSKDRDRLDKLIERAAYINMAGGMHGYQQFAQAEMMMGAGEGMKRHGGGAAGNAMAGAGIGLGFGMANQMMGGMTQPQQPAGQKQPPVNSPIQSQIGQAAKITCGSCRQQVNPGKFCAECGKPLAPSGGPQYCTNCGNPVSGKFCGECGTAVPG